MQKFLSELFQGVKMIGEELALLGGEKTIKKPFKKYNSIGQEELTAAQSVISSGVLSKFIGAYHTDFLGGPKVREFEQAVCDFFQVKHAVTVNSWTSGLIAAVGALGVEPGDEVIVTPWTMAASATAILHWNAIPVFADIDPDTYNICPVSIEKNITSHTRAIVAADIFGLSADMHSIMQIAKKYGLKVISDTAQAPYAKFQDRWAGTFAHIGGFSLNYHKHIHTGEGGILVTNDEDLAEKLQLIRNHAEVVVDGKNIDDISNMIGYNFRLGEIECAIGIEQLKKLPRLATSRQKIAARLTQLLNDLPGLKLPRVPSGSTHVYYVYPMQLDINFLGVSREKICDALEAEGVPILRKYQNVHLLPLFQKKIAYGRFGFPWTAEFCRKDITYDKGICPVAERLQDENFIGLGMCEFDFSENDLLLLYAAFAKVWAKLDLL